MFLFRFADDHIGGKDQEKSKNGLNKVCGGRPANVVGLHKSPVDKGVNGIRRVKQHAGVHGHLIEQAEIRVQDSSDGEQDHGDQHRL